MRCDLIMIFLFVSDKGNFYSILMPSRRPDWGSPEIANSD
jgi:hypothetical protein